MHFELLGEIENIETIAVGGRGKKETEIWTG
jgi:hypothetical protein